MSATGKEAVTLEQLKMLEQQLGGAGGKKYKIETSVEFPTQVQSSASYMSAEGSEAVTISQLKEWSDTLGGASHLRQVR